MFNETNRHYSLRKLSVGLASVLIGISFASGMNSNSVKADTVKGDSNSVQAVVKNSDAVVKTDAESAPEGQNQTPEAVNNDPSAITQDIKQKAVKASEAVAKLQNNTAKDNSDAKNTADDSKAVVKGTAESTSKGTNLAAKQQNTAFQGSDAVGDKAEQSNTSSVVQEDSSAKGDSLADKNNVLKAKAEAAKKAVAVVLRADSSETTLNLNGTNAIDPETLNANKTETIVKADPARGIDPAKFASNGGFDPKIWGTMDTSKWQLDNDGNITGYTGDMSHIIIPNASDFAKAGKSYSQIGISSDEMRNLGDYNNPKANTLAISLTDNKKVKATDTDWINAFYRSTLKQANLEGLDTSNVTNMNKMFYGARSLTNLDVSNWDTGKVTDMNYMFQNASGLTSLDVSNWDTGNVTNMSSMFYDASGLTSLDVSNWDIRNVTNMEYMFNGARGLTDLDVSNWKTGNVTTMGGMFKSASSLTSLDVSNWDTGKVTNMSAMFSGASSLTSLDVSNWDTGNVTYMSAMFYDASGLTSLDVSNWDTSKVTDMYAMYAMFSYNPNLALIANGDKFADYLVRNNFANSRINSDVKSVKTDNAKLLQLLTNDSQHDSATRTIIFTFPANYSPDLVKYHLTKTGNTYQIKQSADYAKSYAQGTVLINATGDITKHHIDTTKKNKLSDTWQPNYNKLVLAHKNSDGTVSFDNVQLPKVPGYKAVVKTIANPVNSASALFAVNFMALPKPAETVSPATPVAIEVAKPIKTEPKVAVTPKVIDLSDEDDKVAVTPKETTWQVANDLEHNTYQVSNDKYTVELPHISNAQLYVIANDSTKDSILFTYKEQNSKYVFKIKFVNGHYLLTTYKIKSGKLVKLIDYNFASSAKIINVILSWFQLK